MSFVLDCWHTENFPLKIRAILSQCPSRDIRAVYVYQWEKNGANVVNYMLNVVYVAYVA